MYNVNIYPLKECTIGPFLIGWDMSKVTGIPFTLSPDGTYFTMLTLGFSAQSTGRPSLFLPAQGLNFSLSEDVMTS